VPENLAGTGAPIRGEPETHIKQPGSVEAQVRPAREAQGNRPSFAVSIIIVTLPLLLSLGGFGFDLFSRLGLLPWWMAEPLLEWEVASFLPPLVIHAPLDWLVFMGRPAIALVIATGLGFYLLGTRRGMTGRELGKLAGDCLPEVGSILLLFGAAGGFKEVIEATGAGDYIGKVFSALPLTPVVVCFLVAVLMRIALGSATAAILAASAVLAKFVQPGQETLLVLAVANGVTFMTQPADSGFWMVKEYCNLSVRDVLVRFNACRIVMSLTGLGLLLLVEWLAN
jgi:H+/gluconate symporter-like permease